MTPARLLWTICIAGTGAALLGLFWLDGAAARSAAEMARAGAAGNAALGWIDIAAGKEISNFLLGFVLLLVGGGLVLLRRKRAGRILFYVGAVQFTATVIADLAKPQFGRLRPYEALQNGAWTDIWWVGANAFPSGHTAFYAGLLFPLVLLAPRWWPLWIAVPLLVAVSRVLAHDHYPSDVAASLALAALLAILFARILPGSAGEAEPFAPEPAPDHQHGDHR